MNEIMENKKATEVLPKTFEDLKKEVHERDLCGECGGCVSFCSASDIKAIVMSEEGPPKYFNKENCLECGICYLVCPQTHVLNEELNSKFEYKPPMGSWKKIVSTQASSSKIKKVATDGGVVTALLIYLLENHLINGAIVSKRKGPFNRVPFFATTNEELIEAAGSHFELSSQVMGLEDYSTFIPTITKLKKLITTDLMNIAVVGTPCQIHSIRKMQELSILPAHIVKYTFGLFCNLNFNFDKEDRDEMEHKFNFSFEDVDNMNIREALLLHFRDDHKIKVDFEKLHPYVRSACFGCSDFSNVYADLSFGGLGSDKKYTTTIIRTEKGEKVYKNALKEGYISEPFPLNTSVKKSEILAKVISFSQRKKQRAEKKLENL